jgi:hypothetical protein
MKEKRQNAEKFTYVTNRKQITARMNYYTETLQMTGQYSM